MDRPESNITFAPPALGNGYPCFIIAEAGVNHNGQISLAKELIDAAKIAGAQAVKFQSFQAALLAGRLAPMAEYQKISGVSAQTQLELLRQLELSAAAQWEIADYCRRLGIVFLSTPFDIASADLLEGLGVPLFKISSGDLTDLDLLSHTAAKGKPLIISTGMANLSEIEQALAVVQLAGSPEVVLLHCVSNYPAEPSAINLRAMLTIQAAFKVPVGYSDHSMGNELAIAAVALGACVIEKHLTLDRSLPGPDQAASAPPQQFQELVQSIRNLEAALGNGIKRPAPSEYNTRLVSRKSLVAAIDLPQDTILERDMFTMQRPGDGLSAASLPLIIGRRLAKAIPAGTTLKVEHFQ